MKNPIIAELEKLKIIDQKNRSIIGIIKKNKTKVLLDKKSGLIYIEKYLHKLKDYQFNRNYSQQDILKYKKLLLKDDKRRFRQFKDTLKNRKILDFGCEYGGFLENINNSKKLYGFEINHSCIKFLKKNLKKINLVKNLDKNKIKFDIITMFHVLEHMPFQVGILKQLRSNLEKNGKIIIEVPSGSDFLLSLKELTSFKDFTFWNEHLILYTKETLIKILKLSGFKNIKLINFQRYDLNNHLGWFLTGKPNGHEIFKNIYDTKLKKAYIDYLYRTNQTDTLIAIADK